MTGRLPPDSCACKPSEPDEGHGLRHLHTGWSPYGPNPWVPRQSIGARLKASFLALPMLVRVLLILQAALYLVVVIAGDLPLLDYVVLSARAVSSGHVWVVLTHLPFHARPDAFGALFDLAILWSLGGIFARRWRPTHFLFFYVAAGVVGGLLHAGAGVLWPSTLAVPYLGSHASSFALLVAFWVVFGETPVSVFGSPPFKGKWVFFCLAALEALLFLTGNNPIFFVQAGGMLAGWLMLTGRWRPRKLKTWLQELARRREKSRFRVIH